MKDCLLILGAGGYGRVVADTAQRQTKWRTVAFLDDQLPLNTSVGPWAVVGRISELEQFPGKFGHAVVAIGDGRKRLHELDRLERAGFSIPSVVDPSAQISSYATLGPGSVVIAQAAINFGAVLGRGCIVNTSSSIDHDCKLGAGVHVCPGARLAGAVSVGELSWIGIGSSVRQNISIGRRVTVGAGAVVVADVADDCVVAGVPAREQFKE